MKSDFISKIEKLASKISQEIEKVTEKKDRHLPPFHVVQKIINGKIIRNNEFTLVVGLNPSATDIDAERGNIDRLLLYVPYIDGIGNKHDPYEMIKHFGNSDLTYNNYFKQPCDLFLGKGFQPIWTNKQYLQQISHNLETDEYNFLNKYPDTGKYVIFSDLLFYKETDSKVLWKILHNDSNLVASVTELFKLQIKFYNPKVVLINNAYGSRIIHDGLFKKSANQASADYNSSIQYKRTRIVFSALVSGGHVDVFAFKRLKREIHNYLG